MGLEHARLETSEEVIADVASASVADAMAAVAALALPASVGAADASPEPVRVTTSVDSGR